MRRVALATAAAFAEGDEDDRLLLAPLAARGIEAVPAVWDDPSHDWAAFDLVVLRSTWDYPPRRDAFLAWARSVPRLVNPAAVVAWNSDKRYLDDLAAAGVPVVPTLFTVPGEDPRLPDAAQLVVKPAISAGSQDTIRHHDRAAASAHARQLLAAGRVVMAQPYVPSVDHDGEIALVHLGGAFSHSVRKGPILQAPSRVFAEGLFAPEDISPRAATPTERAVAEQALATVPGGPLLYGRVDLVEGSDGPLVLELELVEPSLFLGRAEGAADRLAGAIAERLV